MSRRCRKAAAAAAALLLGPALPPAAAYPEGAPWGAANPDARESCGSCHYGYEPVRNSAALSIAGLPGEPIAGERYRLTIRFAPGEAAVAGFQLIAAAPEGAEAGSLESDAAGIETAGDAARSTEPLAVDPEVAWQVTWRAPDELPRMITFYIAASAANDDLSPFGDRIHYRSVTTGGGEPADAK